MITRHEPPWFRFFNPSTGDPWIMQPMLPFSFPTIPQESDARDDTFVETLETWANLAPWREGFEVEFGYDYSFDVERTDGSDHYYIDGGTILDTVTQESLAEQKADTFLPLPGYGDITLNDAFGTGALADLNSDAKYDNGGTISSFGFERNVGITMANYRICKKSDRSGYLVSCLIFATFGLRINVEGFGGDFMPAGESLPIYVYTGEWADAKPVFVAAGATNPDTYATSELTLETEEVIGTFFGVDVKWRRFKFIRTTFAGGGSGGIDSHLENPVFNVS